ncbi:MAG: hypothetical protein O2905_06980, partial [Proteobacteria bacterium]|nr:hypothetical protein [Pseudomonadota bacterium]
AAGVAFVLAYFVAVGLPAWPATGSAHKVFYLGLAGLLIGIVLDAEDAGDRLKRGATLALPFAALAWVVVPVVSGAMERETVMLIAALAAALVVMFVRLSRVAGSAVTPPIHLAVAAAGVAAIAWYGGSFFQVQVGLILAASATGFVLWNWPVYRFAPGAALLLGIGIPVAALAAQMALYGGASKPALALLVLVFFSDWIAGGIRLGGGPVAVALRPVLVLLAGLLVVGAAALVTVLMASPGR